MTKRSWVLAIGTTSCRNAGRLHTVDRCGLAGPAHSRSLVHRASLFEIVWDRFYFHKHNLIVVNQQVWWVLRHSTLEWMWPYIGYATSYLLLLLKEFVWRCVWMCCSCNCLMPSKQFRFVSLWSWKLARLDNSSSSSFFGPLNQFIIANYCLPTWQKDWRSWVLPLSSLFCFEGPEPVWISFACWICFGIVLLLPSPSFLAPVPREMRFAFVPSLRVVDKVEQAEKKKFEKLEPSN